MYLTDEPHAGGSRPLSQGDVFVNIPLVGGAQPHAKQAGTWVARTRTGPNALGLFVTHPCAARSSTTYKLHPFISIAPVVKCPSNWGPPWEGHYDLVPLPRLRDGTDYVAKLAEVCPVPREALEGRRIAVLTAEGLQAFFHRLAMKSLRFPETPMHYQTEAQRVTNEVNLWERWTMGYGTEDGFESWLDEPFEGQTREDSEGNLIEGSQTFTGGSRRSVLVWNYDELSDELDAKLARS